MRLKELNKGKEANKRRDILVTDSYSNGHAITLLRK